jgi:hypothetical protein
METNKNIINKGHSYFITTRRKMNINDLIIRLHDKQQEVDFVRKNNAYNIFKPNFSTRGVELSEVNDRYMLKMNFLASVDDYILCNYMAHIICKKFDGILVDEEGKRRRIGKLFNEMKMNEYIKSEAEKLFTLLKNGNEIEIVGTVRPFSIGKRTRDKVLLLKKEKYEYEKALKLTELILACQYPPPMFIPYCDMMENMVNNEKVYFAQVLSNKHNVVIEKVRKYFISEIYGNISIELTIENIIKIMPPEWELLDECTVLAKKLPQDKWNNFVEAAKQLGRIIE